MPIFYATGSRKKAFFWATLSGVAELLGALLGWLVLRKVFSQVVYGITFGVIAGMMVYIALKDLLPTAHRYDPDDQVTTLSLISGMLIMSVSLVLFLFCMLIFLSHLMFSRFLAYLASCTSDDLFIFSWFVSAESEMVRNQS